jgi:hypothetical protein
MLALASGSGAGTGDVEAAAARQLEAEVTVAGCHHDVRFLGARCDASAAPSLGPAAAGAGPSLSTGSAQRASLSESLLVC